MYIQIIKLLKLHLHISAHSRSYSSNSNQFDALSACQKPRLTCHRNHKSLSVDFPIIAEVTSVMASLSRSVLLRHDGSYPIIESIEFDKNSMDFDFQDLQPLIISKKDAWKCELLFNPITFQDGFSYNSLELEIVVDSQTEIMEINNFKSFDHLIDLVIEQINYVRESNELPIFAHRDDFNQNKVVLRYDVLPE